MTASAFALKRARTPQEIADGRAALHTAGYRDCNVCQAFSHADAWDASRYETKRGNVACPKCHNPIPLGL